MTYRVKLQRAGQKVVEQTVTESYAVARFAFCDLLNRHVGKQYNVSWTERKRGANKAEQVAFFKLRGTSAQGCDRCQYVGPFIDDGECCPNCRLIQIDHSAGSSR